MYTALLQSSFPSLSLSRESSPFRAVTEYLIRMRGTPILAKLLRAHRVTGPFFCSQIPTLLLRPAQDVDARDSNLVPTRGRGRQQVCGTAKGVGTQCPPVNPRQGAQRLSSSICDVIIALPRSLFLSHSISLILSLSLTLIVVDDARPLAFSSINFFAPEEDSFQVSEVHTYLTPPSTASSSSTSSSSDPPPPPPPAPP